MARDSVYADSPTCLSKCTKSAECVVERITQVAILFAVLQGWMKLLPNLIFEEEELTVVHRFGYVGSCLTKNGSMVGEASTLIYKAGAVSGGSEPLLR